MKLLCWYCHKPITTEIPNNTLFRGIDICPECIAKVPEEIVKQFDKAINDPN